MLSRGSKSTLVVVFVGGDGDVIQCQQIVLETVELTVSLCSNSSKYGKNYVETEVFKLI